MEVSGVTLGHWDPSYASTRIPPRCLNSGGKFPTHGYPHCPTDPILTVDMLSSHFYPASPHLISDLSLSDASLGSRGTPEFPNPNGSLLLSPHSCWFLPHPGTPCPVIAPLLPTRT